MHTQKSIQVGLRLTLALFIALAGVLQASAAPVQAQHPDPCVNQLEIYEAECQALVSIYNSTGGANWNNKTNWLVEPYSPSTWYGITISSGHVTGISLWTNNLVNALPDVFDDLPELTKLDFYRNHLTGGIPASITERTTLTYLDLGTNQLSGEIPAELGNLTELTYLSLSNNDFSGTIPTELENLNKLSSLYLDNNGLDGEIPDELGNMDLLNSFNASNNLFNGEIPAWIWSSTTLQWLSLASNDLTGSIPDSINTGSELNYVRLEHNQLSGSLPTELGELTNLGAIFLQDNAFSGTLPDSFGSNPKLLQLYLSNNHFSGEFPATFVGKNMTEFNISYNHFAAAATATATWIDGEQNNWYYSQSPKPLTPADGAVTGDTTPTFTFSALAKGYATNVDSYELQVHEQGTDTLIYTETVPTSSCSATTCTYTSATPLDLGDYYFTVRAHFDVWAEYYGENEFSVVQNPAAPDALTPSGTITASNPVFTWSKISDVTQYQVMVYNSSDVNLLDKTITAPTCDTTTCSYTPSPALVLANGSYKWKVRAYKEVWGDYSALKTFAKTNSPAPQFPSGTTTAANPVFTWSKVASQTQYRVVLYNSSSTVLLDKIITTPVCTTTTCTYTPSPALTLANGSYKWKVKSYNGVWGDYYGYKTFSKVNPPTPQFPTATTTAANPVFTWSKVASQTQYRVVLYTSGGTLRMDKTITAPVCTSTTCSYTPSPALTLANGSYKWKVKSYNGAWGDYSAYKTFTKTNPPAPLFPSITTTSKNPTFTWSKVSSQTQYRVVLYTSGGTLRMDKIITTPVCGSTTCSYTPSTSLALVNGNYKWKVKSFNGYWGDYSAYKTFSKVNPPSPTSPSGTITSSNPKFTWTKVSGATRYTIEIARSTGTLVRSKEITTPVCTSTTCSYTPSPTLGLAKGDYKWRVKAYNGSYGDFSAYKTFKKQ